MENNELNEKVLASPICQQPLKKKEEVVAFLRFLWTDLELNFDPDDDFREYGPFDETAASLLNARMDEAFDLLKGQVYELAINLMAND